MMRKRPLWYYGILCLMASALPQVLFPPPKDPQEISARFNAMLLFSAVGLVLIGVSAVQIWRKRD
jgi:hypothetical protein